MTREQSELLECDFFFDVFKGCTHPKIDSLPETTLFECWNNNNSFPFHDLTASPQVKKKKIDSVALLVSSLHC